MRPAFPSAVLLFMLASTPAIATTLPDRPLKYTIEVALDNDGKTLRGTETIAWRNDTDAPAPFLAFHLYMNAFSGSETVFMRESRGRHRRFGFDEDDPGEHGWCRVKRVWVDGTEKTADFKTLTQIKNPERFGLYAPDEVAGTKGPDDTLAVLELEAGVQPGGWVEVKLEFETRLPQVFARTGRHKTFVMAGQWFPKLAVFEGTKGWNAHLFHADSEFFSDFAAYTVTVDLPAAYIVGATGVPIEEKTAGGRRRTTFHAHQVIDFAFTAWDKFRVAKDRWKDVDLVLLHPPGNEAAVGRQFGALKAAMDAMAELCGFAYPYPRLTLVDPPRGAEGAGGMEYPMLITGWTSGPTVPMGFVEETIIHEFAHNYFYAILASNEFEDPWMDEGMTTYATTIAMERAGFNLLDRGPFAMGSLEAERMVQGLYKGREAPAKAAWRYAGTGPYDILNYSRVAVVLKTLERMIGPENNTRLWRTYAGRYKFRHPRPDDFFAVVRQEAGETAAAFLEGALLRGETPDFAVRRARSEKLSGRPLLRYDPAKGKMTKEKRPKEPERHRIEVVVENRGHFHLPVELLCVLEDGTERRFAWDGAGDWKAFEFEAASPLATAVSDPDGRYPCDRNLANNARVSKPRTNGNLARLSSAAALAAQLVLGCVL